MCLQWSAKKQTNKQNPQQSIKQKNKISILGSHATNSLGELRQIICFSVTTNQIRKHEGLKENIT